MLFSCMLMHSKQMSTASTNQSAAAADTLTSDSHKTSCQCVYHTPVPASLLAAQHSSTDHGTLHYIKVLSCL